MSAAVLRPIMSKYSSTDIAVVVLGGPDVDVLALAQGEAGLVVQAHQAQDLGVARSRGRSAGGARSGSAMKSVSPVLIAWGMPWSDHSVGPVAALDVAVLDVVVDEAEVVAELHGRGAGQGRLDTRR